MDPTPPDHTTAAQGAGNPPEDWLPAGTRMGEFEILGVVGMGGFGIVYRAFDHDLEREVAVKEYMPGMLANRNASGMVTTRSRSHAETFGLGLRSFVNEARLLARFDHPALLRVFRFWEANGTAYMAMPFYDGQTLGATLKTLGAPPSQAWLMAIIDPLLGALDLLHGQQVFHRDIAPDNILLLPSGMPVLLDFGAARRVISDRTQTLTAILKPNYAPIEQYAEVTGLRQGPWTDFYALAAVVYAALTGRPPAPAATRAVVDDSTPFAEIGERLRASHGLVYDAAFLAAWQRCLAIRPGDRPQGAAELRSLLGLPALATSAAPTRGSSAAAARSPGATEPPHRTGPPTGHPAAAPHRERTDSRSTGADNCDDDDRTLVRPWPELTPTRPPPTPAEPPTPAASPAPAEPPALPPTPAEPPADSRPPASGPAAPPDPITTPPGDPAPEPPSGTPGDDARSSPPPANPPAASTIDAAPVAPVAPAAPPPPPPPPPPPAPAPAPRPSAPPQGQPPRPPDVPVSVAGTPAAAAPRSKAAPIAAVITLLVLTGGYVALSGGGRTEPDPVTPPTQTDGARQAAGAASAAIRAEPEVSATAVFGAASAASGPVAVAASAGPVSGAIATTEVPTAASAPTGRSATGSVATPASAVPARTAGVAPAATSRRPVKPAPAASAAPVVEVAPPEPTPTEVCGARVLFAYWSCMKRECEKPAFAQSSECREVRERIERDEAARSRF